MKKKPAIFCLLGALAFGACPVSAADGTKEIPAAFRNIKVVVDGKGLSTSAEPFIYNGTAYLPVRAVGEAVGMEVSWDESSNTVTLQTPPPTIETDGTAEGRTDFELAVTPSGKQERTEILRVNEKENDRQRAYSLYYYGLSDVSITIDGQTLPLAEALQEGMLSPTDILRKCSQDAKNGKIISSTARGSGGTSYWEKDYTIMELFTMEGNYPEDLYIGITEMKMSKLIGQYYPHFGNPTVEWVIEQCVRNVTSPDYTPEHRQALFEDGLELIEYTARLYELPDEEIRAIIQQFVEQCGIKQE